MSKNDNFFTNKIIFCSNFLTHFLYWFLDTVTLLLKHPSYKGGVQPTGFGVWVGMLWASRIIFGYILVVAGHWKQNDWFWCRARAWPSPGYIKVTVLFSSCGAWSSWSSNNLAYIERALINFTLRSMLIPFFSSFFFSDVTFRLHILSIVFRAAHFTNHYPSSALVDCLGVCCLYPVRCARPTARLMASMSQLGIMSR